MFKLHRCRSKIKGPAIAVLMLTASTAAAERVTSATVDRDSKGFSIHFSVEIDAGVDEVTEMIGDIRNLARLSPSTVSSEALSPGEGINIENQPWVGVVLRPCVLIFCKTLTKVSRVIPISTGVTRYEVIDAHSSFKTAVETLTLAAADDGTVLTYDAELVPGFFVPPIIGSWLVRRVIVEEISEAARRAEREIQSR